MVLDKSLLTINKNHFNIKKVGSAAYFFN